MSETATFVLAPGGSPGAGNFALSRGVRPLEVGNFARGMLYARFGMLCARFGMPYARAGSSTKPLSPRKPFVDIPAKPVWLRKTGSANLTEPIKFRPAIAPEALNTHLRKQVLTPRYRGRP